MSKATKKHYLDGEKFTAECIIYIDRCNKAREAGDEVPVVPDFIAESILKLCENLSLSPNFIGYTYRDDMIMDAVENCLKAVSSNFDPRADTRSGKSNAFGYFSRIAYFAMVRRITKEKKVTKLKDKIISTATPLEFVEGDAGQASHYIENLVGLSIKD